VPGEGGEGLVEKHAAVHGGAANVIHVDVAGIGLSNLVIFALFLAIRRLVEQRQIIASPHARCEIARCDRRGRRSGAPSDGRIAQRSIEVDDRVKLRPCATLVDAGTPPAPRFQAPGRNVSFNDE
jgi:hypothetical protein